MSERNNKICAGHNQCKYWEADTTSHADGSDQPDCCSGGKAIHFIFSHKDQPCANKANPRDDLGSDTRRI